MKKKKKDEEEEQDEEEEEQQEGILLHLFVSRSPISLFHAVPHIGITLPEKVCFLLCPMSVSRSPISLFPVVSHLGVTLPDLSVSRCDPSRYHAPR